MDDPIEIDCGTCVLQFSAGAVKVRPSTRPGDWRTVPLAALDAWLAKQWRERAMDPEQQ